MKINVALLPDLLPENWSNGHPVAIVIDTLRFTTTACAALHAGAEEVQVTAEVEAARQLAARLEGEVKLCGERFCKPIAGFHLGNSPDEYTAERVGGRPLIFTTTNGTRAVSAARSAPHIWLASLTNRRAVVEALREEQPQAAWLICSGTDGQVALEDVLTAGAILEELTDQVAGDAAWLALETWQGVTASVTAGGTLTEELVRRFKRVSGGSNLVESGYADDLEAAARMDTVQIVPRNSDVWNRFSIV